MKSPFVQKSVEQPQSNKKRSGNPCYTIICWFVSLLLWGLIGVMTVSIYIYKIIDDKSLVGYGYFGIALYVVYLILEFCSGTCRYLIHKRSSEGIKAKLGEIFKSRPEIKFYVECYHYETEYYTVRNSKGEEERRSRQVKVVTHTETHYFSYYSVRDISGLLNLNCDVAQIKRKCYIKLELNEEMNFADAISVSDYEKEKEEFKDRNRYKDDFMDFSEKWSLPGMVHHNLIKIGDYEPCTVNCFWYFIFTLFTLAQIYKWHVSSFSIYQNYKIRKIISTRYNLHSEQYDSQYSKFNPQLNLIILKIDYEPAYYTYLNTSKTVDLPTQEELEKAKMYDSKVPKYEIYTEADGDIQRCGTIKDNPDFQAYNSYQAPELNIPNPNNNINKNENEGYNSTQQGVGAALSAQPTGGINSQPSDGIYSGGSGIYAQPPGDTNSKQRGSIL